VNRVAVISMGGTIAMAPSASGGIVPSLGADDLVASVPGLAELDVKITTESLRSLPSPSLGFADLVALSARVRAELAAGATGVVITHGTDTMVETARTLAGIPGKTIVLTGALQPGRFADSDAPFNLGMAMAAVQLLPAGVYLAANGRVFEAYRVVKNAALNRFEALEGNVGAANQNA